MHYQYLQHPDWWLRCSKGPDSDSAADSDADARKCAGIGAPFYTSGDSHFNPPEEGMLVFDDSKPEVSTPRGTYLSSESFNSSCLWVRL